MILLQTFPTRKKERQHLDITDIFSQTTLFINPLNPFAEVLFRGIQFYRMPEK